MGEPKIPGGYVIKARVIKTKTIHRMPPYVREIWDYCLREANHDEAIHKGNVIKRGQLFRQYKDIREDLCWYIGYRKMMYNENHTKKAMKALREAGMIDTMKTLGGVLITVLNYDFYQDPKNYERTNEKTIERTTKEPAENQGIPDNNKNKKKEKKKEENKDSIDWVINYLNQKCGTNYKLTTQKTRSLIEARIKEGNEGKDFKTVIDKKHSHWFGTDDAQYLRPETLFGTKFESYLNQIIPNGEMSKDLIRANAVDIDMEDRLEEFRNLELSDEDLKAVF